MSGGEVVVWQVSGEAVIMKRFIETSLLLLAGPALLPGKELSAAVLAVVYYLFGGLPHAEHFICAQCPINTTTVEKCKVAVNTWKRC